MISEPHSGAMISPWKRDRIEARPLNATEVTMLRAIQVAEQRILEARHAIMGAAQLPVGHPAIEELDGFTMDAIWLINGYLAEAKKLIDAQPEAERQAAEDAAEEGP